MYTNDLDNDPRGTGSAPEMIDLHPCDCCNVQTPEDQIRFFRTVRMFVCFDCIPKEKVHALEAENEDYLSEILTFEASQRIPNQMSNVRVTDL